MPEVGDYVTIVNRAPWKLETTWDGRIYTHKPGENPNTPFIVAQFAKLQHPIMGTESPYDWNQVEYQVGIKAPDGEEQKDDISPLAAEVLGRSVERLDRRFLPKASVEDSGMRLSRGAVAPQGQATRVLVGSKD